MTQTADDAPIRRTNEELLAIIGSWAKAEHPEKYAATLAQVAKPVAFRNYLLRLIEIRADEATNNDFISTLPVSVLDETSIKRTLVIRSTGDRFVVAGKGYGEAAQLSWTMLDTDKESFAALTRAITVLDLEVVR